MVIKKTDFSPTNSFFAVYENDEERPTSSLHISRSGWMPYWVNKTLEKNFNKDKSEQVFYLSSFCTKVKRRHKGYGRKLLEYVKDFYNGCILVLEVSSTGEMSNEQLKAFYESVGFIQILPIDGIETMHYTMIIDLR